MSETAYQGFERYPINRENNRHIPAAGRRYVMMHSFEIEAVAADTDIPEDDLRRVIYAMGRRIPHQEIVENPTDAAYYGADYVIDIDREYRDLIREVVEAEADVGHLEYVDGAVDGDLACRKVVDAALDVCRKHDQAGSGATPRVMALRAATIHPA
ncbi:hypothetical protein C475_08952 [Halosimplex carlsbadense 2-9-1]|uniref:Uncharacterized protein n=1 Tax=Halosimplex carlsbadense 2-9-1 TaxID=797114 RepID=M0CVV4_9EURY|nr:hypothetical protein [Halosimplex carlsbadense]ELZ26542.1 hypothetical protein C475_08952 [Halosimplex carlsbadense 2-9-1]